MNEAWSVKLTLSRVQSWLFAADNLKTIVGANALLGETLRGVWDGSKFEIENSLPGLAQACSSRAPQSIVNLLSNLPPTPRQEDDPIRSPRLANQSLPDQDAPVLVACRTGVLSRDGGHFEALFATRDDATKFLQNAELLLARQLPGLDYDARLCRIAEKDGGWTTMESTNWVRSGHGTVAPFDLPVGEVCELTGEGMATERISTAKGEPLKAISSEMHDRWERGNAFNRGETRDILGLLRYQLLEELGFDAKTEFPRDFDELSDSGYMAVIHIDGNNVGSRSKAISGTGEFFHQWRCRELFFHQLRAGFRAAFMRACKVAFGQKKKKSGRPPVRPMMLGGDDLLLVCDAPLAMPFVVAFARLLKTTTAALPLSDGEAGPLTVGAGVAIVKNSFPFSSAHEIAEQLALSAKRLRSSLPDPNWNGDVVDWVVVTESWHGDIVTTRRQDCLVHSLSDTLILSGKPYRILMDELSASDDKARLVDTSLEQMLRDADSLLGHCGSEDGESQGTKDTIRGVRSQLKSLVEQIPRGRHTARFAADVLPVGLRDELVTRRYLSREEGPWRVLRKRHDTQTALLMTRVPDLLELYELARIGSNTRNTESGSGEEKADWGATSA